MSFKALESIQKPIFSTAEAKAKGVSPQMLAYFVKRGILIRISQGIYQRAGEHDLISDDILIQKAMLEVPSGVIGRRSALKHYGITDINPRSLEMIVPTNRVPRRKNPDVIFFTAPLKTMTHGIVHEHGLRVTSLERTLIECLTNGISYAEVRKAFEAAQTLGLKPGFPEMNRFAKLLRANGKFKILKETLL